MYKSPITIIESTIDSFNKAIIKQKDDAIFAEIQHSFGVDVDRQELIRALKYDRDQYEKGYKDGKADATPKWIPVTERLPEKKGNYLGFTGSTFMVGYYKGDAVWWIWVYDREGVDLFTHWMPLPEPPEGE